MEVHANAQELSEAVEEARRHRAESSQEEGQQRAEATRELTAQRERADALERQLNESMCELEDDMDLEHSQNTGDPT